jgi:hypothetical protein
MLGPEKTSTYYWMQAKVVMNRHCSYLIGVVKEEKQALYLHHGNHHG